MAMVNMAQIEPLKDAADLLHQPEDLRRQAAEDGYLFFAGLLDSARVLNFRRQILLICAHHDWTKEGMASMEGIANPNPMVVEGGDPRWQAFYRDVQTLLDCHQLALDDNLIRVLEVLFGEPVLPHIRNICRLVFPNSVSPTTPLHQDNLYIGGSEEAWTAWFACGDLSRFVRQIGNG